MKYSFNRLLAIFTAALFMLALICSGACIEFDKPTDPVVTEPAETAGDAPDGSQEANSSQQVPPDVLPSPGSPDASPGPGTTPDSSSSAGTTPDASSPSGTGAAPTSTPGGTTPTTTPAPTQPGTTPAPTDEPVVVTGLIWFDDSAPVFYDIDFDGKPERIELKLISVSSYSYSCLLRITVGATGKELIDSFTTEYFTKALINNFNAGDGRAEIMVCGGTGNKGQVTRASRLNAASSAIETISVPGWIETVSGNSIEFGRYIDLLGTWSCSATFAFSKSDFALVQQGTEWQVHRDSERWCTVANDFLVEIYVNNSIENYAGFLYTGDKIYPTATDFNSYIRFTSDIGDNGSIGITVNANGKVFINGDPVDHWFSDLQYIN